MTDLPPLPKKLNKREANVTPKIIKWFKENYPESVALEIKSTNTNSIPRSAVKDHQLAALLAASSLQGMSHKLSDEARRQQPFDAFILKATKSFVVAHFSAHGPAAAPIYRHRSAAGNSPG